MRLIIAILLFFVSLPLLWAEEKPEKAPAGKMPALPISSYDLPREQVQEYRAIEAEERAMRAEATLALQSLEKRRTEILDGWKAQAGGSLEGWQLDLSSGKLVFPGIPPGTKK